MIKFSEISKSKRIVIKIGSSLLINENGKGDQKWLENFAEDILNFKKKEIIIVASGAVSLGKKYLDLSKHESNINFKQAYAACGQVILMNNFIKVFQKKKKKVAQVLLTFSDTENRRRSLNSRETLINLIARNVIPVINENDTVATDELKFGDNDRLAARVAQIIEADLLILLSDVKGLYNKNPAKFGDAKMIEVVKKIDSKIFKMASGDTNMYGSGGMITKVQAAEIAGSFGCNTLILEGKEYKPLTCFKKKKIGTLFISDLKKKRGIKSWLAGSINISGSITIDKGAIEALKKGASLLPSGIIDISGAFSKGDILEVISYDKKKLGRGITYYDSDDVERLKGKKTIHIKEVLGYQGRDEIIHRDYLYLIR